MFEAISFTINVLLTPASLLLILLSSIIGLFFGAVPGLSGVLAMVMVLPFTYSMDPLQAMLIFSVLAGVGSFAGSIPAILLNTPGTAPNALTCLDGFPLAQRGEPVRALAISGMSSLTGIMFGALVLLAVMPAIRNIVLAFGTTETFWLIMLGLVGLALALRQSFLKGLAAGGLGILLSLVGLSDVFPDSRFTFGSIYLLDKFPLIPMLLGLFALSEVLVYSTRESISAPEAPKLSRGETWRQMKAGISDVLSRIGQVLRGSFIGTVIGAVPALGGLIASFISYTIAQQFSKEGALFGKGSVEGIIASETANDSKEGGAMIPTLGFGIPGSADMAVLLGALTFFGLEVGPRLLLRSPEIALMLIYGLILGQIMVTVIGFCLFTTIAKVTSIPTSYIAPVVTTFSLCGAYIVRGNVWDLFFVIIVAFLGYGIKRFGYPILPLVIGFLLGSEAERTFFITLRGSEWQFFGFVESPVSITLALLVLAVIISALVQILREKQRGDLKTEYLDRGDLCFTGVLMVIALLFVLGAAQYQPPMHYFPLIVGIPTVGFLGGLFLFRLGQVLKPAEMRDLTRESLAEPQGVGGASNVTVRGVAAWLILFDLSVFVLGFVVSVPVFSYVFLRSEPPLARLAFSLGSFAVVFFGFSLSLPQGIWMGIIPWEIPYVLGGGVLSDF